MKNLAHAFGYVVVAALALLLFAAGPAPAQPPQTTPNTVRAATPPGGNAANGQKAFMVHTCYTCHGYNAEGGVGFRLVNYPDTLDAFISYVKQPKLAMPPGGAKITQQEFLDIYTWLRTLPASPDAKTIDLLKPDAPK